MVFACPGCDLLNFVDEVPEGASARCIRCGAELYTRKKNSIDRTLAFAVTGLILLLIANAYPVLLMKSEGALLKTTLFQAVKALYTQDMQILAALVFFTCILAPVIQLGGLLYILLPLRWGRTAWKAPLVFRCLRKLQPWGMMEVLMLGILVSIVKLAKMALVIPGLSLYALAVLVFVLAAAVYAMDPHLIWEKIGDDHE